jgi:predicted nuclease with TOPRIM domain
VTDTITRGNEARDALNALRTQVAQLEQRKDQLVTEIAQRQDEVEALKRALSEQTETLEGPGV